MGLGLASPITFASSPVSCLSHKQYASSFSCLCCQCYSSPMRFSCFCVCHYQKTCPSVLLLPCVVPSWVTSSFLALSFLQIHETHCPKSLLLQERRLHSSLHFHNASWPQLLSPQRNKKRSLGAGCATLFGFLSQSRRRRGTAGSGRGKVLQNSWWQARIQRRRSERKGLEIKTDSKSLGLRLASVQ